MEQGKTLQRRKVTDKILTEENPLRIKQLGRKVFAFDKKSGMNVLQYP